MDYSLIIDSLLGNLADLSEELREITRRGSASELLAWLATTALNPRYTERIFTHSEPLFVDTCARWIALNAWRQAVPALGRIIWFAPHLAEFAEKLLEVRRDDHSMIDDDELREYLLGLFRLLTFDCEGFKSFVPLDLVYQSLEHQDRSIRYLAIRVLCQFLQAADSAKEAMVKRHLGEGEVIGPWEEKTIDFCFFVLWEKQRYEGLATQLESARLYRDSRFKSGVTKPMIFSECFSNMVADIHGVLLPRVSGTPSSESPPFKSLISTPSTISNLRSLSRALLNPEPVIISGLAGSGKTRLVAHLAWELNKSRNLVTLHLNEQTDAKSLLGMYTSGVTPGSFDWRPGVLTTAVREGRWVFIEDLDRAPNEVMSTLLPLIERGELLVAGRGETIRAARGFKIIATLRSQKNHRGEEIVPGANMLGSRFWRRVALKPLTDEEIQDVVQQLYPTLAGHISNIMAVYFQARALLENSKMRPQSGTASSRPVTLRDLLKWCDRMHAIVTHSSGFSTAQLDDFFLEAVDCFAGSMQLGGVRDLIEAVIAEGLQIDPKKRDYLLQSREIRFAGSGRDPYLQIGRTSLPRAVEKSVRDRAGHKRPFAANGHTLRLMEKIAVAVERNEPLLLVGETGTGKTTCIQHLAAQVGRKMVAFNLSQQSETGDLLGGFKPVTVRSIVIPLKDEFDELFEATFSRKNNQAFLVKLGDCVAKSRWKAVCKLWKGALSMVDDLRNRPAASSHSQAYEQPKKRRKVDTVEARWNKFAASVRNLEARLASQNDAFAFSFIEGNIVKAVRNGDWVLLDEINLASPDTLEAVADLLGGGPDGTPSLLLLETGNVERVEAHPNFRVFAAMNPATDVGKRDLPSGIRSRFTELYVDSPDRDRESLLAIVRTYLPGSEQAIASRVTDLYREIQSLLEANRLVDSADQKPHFSLRTLTRTLTYARDIAPLCSLRRALYEGFHMSFLTFLNTSSENLIAPLIKQYLFANHSNAAAELGRPMRQPHDGHDYVSNGHYWLRQGTSPLQAQSHYIITPFVRRNLDNLIRAASTRRFPVLLQGPTSSGKTSMIEHLAKISGNKFVRINNHEHTDLQEYLGTYVSGIDGQLQFQEGVLVKALREGHWIVLDELNLAPTDVLEALNRLLDDNRELLIPETQETVRPHENFMLFATQNPAGLYGGRKVLSRAFRNRFLELHFDDIPVEELTEILYRRTQIPESWSKRIVEVYKKLSDLRQENRIFEEKSFATLRDLFRWALRKADNVEDLAVNGYMLLAERVRKPGERRAVKDVIDSVMSSARGPHGRINEQLLYDSSHSPEIQLYNNKINSTEVVWTKAMRRLFVLVAHALRNDEPVLLVGETGCGKTTVCQMLADAMKKSLSIVNAHQNTETGDLIGSQRPIRNRAAIEEQLRNELLMIFQRLQTSATTLTDTNSLLEEYDNLSNDIKSDIPQDMQNSIKARRQRLSALFEWSDGSLVSAMKTGDFFLLDEISLADDSVLERLNSVLEPHRTILLAEKGPHDSEIVAQDGFQFLATMNPGGDYGKKELSPALRNRFTEIWVPALSEENDIMQIVQAKLNPRAVKYANAIVAFSEWFNGNYNRSAAATISIRDTLAWVTFINQFSEEGVLHAFVHGAAMVFIDTLGANPAAILAIAGSSVQEERERCLKELGRLLNFDVATIYYQPLALRISNQSFEIGPFTLPLTGLPESDPTFTLTAPTTRNNAMRVARALQLAKPILLEGNPGVGKTTLVTALARATGTPLTRINLSEQTDLMDLFGSDVPVEGAQAGTFAWKDAPFLRAMKQGHWVLLDEMNLASQPVLEGLNACLDHRGEVYITELDQTFQRHADFRIFAAQNPHHQGGGRKGLPASFVNRFTVVYADVFSAEDLLLICKQGFANIADEDIENLIRFIDALENEYRLHKFGNHGSPWEFNLRDVLRWLNLEKSTHGLLPAGKDYDLLDIIFTQRFRTLSDRAHVKTTFGHVFKNQSPERNYYHNQSLSTFQAGLGLIKRSKLLQFVTDSRLKIINSQLPCVESCLIALQENWPIILSGSAASGKTSIVRLLAAVSGARLTTFSMNADIDATDLVGGYEQADPVRQQRRFLSKLQCFLQVVLIECHRDHSYTDLSKEIVRILQSVNADGFPAVERLSLGTRLPKFATNPARSAEISELLKDLTVLQYQILEDTKAKFEWVDGLLVQALEQGHWLVLDNANLCSSAVLDRLNSLLEPNGFLSINEHASDDGEARIVRPHQNFRIILTLDPRHGELSRAMRNRAVEIFVMTTQDCLPSLSLPSFQLESSMYRFQHFTQLASANDVSSSLKELATVALEHLSVQDSLLVQRWCGQMLAGLCSTSMQPHLLVQSDLLDRAWEYWTAVNWSIHTLMSVEMDLSLDFSSAQPINPIYNQYLAQYNEHNQLVAFEIAKLSEICLDVSIMEQKLARVKDEDGKKGRLTRLQRSFGAKPTSRLSKDPIAQVGVFLTAVKDLIADWTASAIAPGTNNMPNINPIQAVCRFWHHLFWLTDTNEVDEAVFQTYLNIGRDVFSLFKDRGSPLALSFRQEIVKFRERSTFRTGRSMERIWTTFSPRSVTTWDRLQAALSLEKLADRFDSIMWRVSANVEQLEQLRIGLTRAINAVRWENADPAGLLTDLGSAISDIESRSTTDEGAPPVLVNISELILQLLECCPTLPRPNSRMSQLALTARRPTKLMLPDLDNTPTTDKVSYILGSILGQYSYGGTSNFAGNVLGASLLQTLNSVGNVSLASLAILRKELEITGETISADAESLTGDRLQYLDELLKDIFFMIRVAHNDIPPSQPEINGRNLTNDSESHEVELSLMVDQLLEPVMHYLGWNKDLQNLEAPAHAWIHIGLAGLQLYIPDHAFDPALKPRILQQFWFSHREDLNRKITALKDFESIFSGSSSNLRMEMIQDEIVELGDTPSVPATARPPKSELQGLQTEFTNVIHLIVRVRQALDHHEHEALLDQTLAQNLEQIGKRISSRYRGYEDITAPAVLFLRALMVGFGLLKQAVREEGKHAMVSYVTQSHPLISATAGFWTTSSISVFPMSRSGTIESRFHALGSMGLARSVSADVVKSAVFRENVQDLFELLYHQWKSELSLEQAKAAADSSLYAYRGGDDEQVDSEEAELQELFPDVEGADTDKAEGKANNPRELAIKLSDLHQQIYLEPESSLEKLEQLNHLTVDVLCRVNAQDSSTLHLQEVLSLVISSISRTLDGTESSVKPAHSYSFYNDPNIVEGKRLVVLVRKIQQRYDVLQKAWPEHATLAEVQRISKEALGFAHTEPVVKFLTKTEKLHEAMNEWEKVASKEYSAAMLFDELTSLLISWRQLELSTWGRLLDMESEKCRADAKSWFFIAYETIVMAPKSATNLQEFAQELFRTLETFFTNTTLGQYSERLRLLKQFKAQLAVQSLDNPELIHVDNALHNFINYFTRFEKSVNDEVAQGRQKLEKNVKEVLLLASWKDRNIDALRQSAKTSHHKLFKIVKKFRAILKRPVQYLLDQALPDIDNVQVSQHKKPDKIVFPQDPEASRISEFIFLAWKSRPIRYVNLGLTTSKMKEMSQSNPHSRKDVVAHINSFLSDILSSISQLRKETPSVQTGENTELIKHLKTRKRKLLSDALKELRRWGLKSSLGTNVLVKQASLSAVLSKIRPNKNENDQHLHKAENYLQNILQAMPQIRMISREHSGDLTPAEVARCVTYLEDLLHIQIMQREFLSKKSANLSDLKSVQEQIKALWAPEEYDVKRKSRSELLLNDIMQRPAWLQMLCSYGAEIVEMQAKLGKFSSFTIVNSLKKWSSTFSELQNTIKHLPKLPAGLQTTLHEKAFQSVAQALQDLGEDIRKWKHEVPAVRHVFKFLRPWTEPSPRQTSKQISKTAINGLREPISNSIIIRVQDVLDMVLGTMQDLQKTFSAEVLESSWLLAHNDEQQSAITALRISTITSALQSILNDLQHMDLEHGEVKAVGALFASVMPIIDQYVHIVEDAVESYAQVHLSISKVSYHFTKSFSEIGRQGFCTPAEKSNEKDGDTDKLEGGTGLGEGEGAEDISKDVQDDEDLNDLAQEPNQRNDKDEIEDEKDAVDMAGEDLEGEMGDAPEKESDENGESDAGEDDIDSEVGSVDDLGPSTVDEKMWNNEEGAEDNKEKEGDQGKGKQDEDQVAAQDSKDQKENGDEGAEEEEQADAGADENEATTRDQLEQTDAHVQEEEALDLPDDIDMDGDKSEVSDGSLSNMEDDFPDVEDGPAMDADMEDPAVPEEPSNEQGPDDLQADDVDEKTRADDEEGDPEIQENEDTAAVPDDSRTGEEALENANIEESQAQSAGAEAQDDKQNESSAAATDQEKGAKGENTDLQPQAAGNDDSGDQTAEQEASGRNDESPPTEKDTFKKLGDTLERWYRQQRQIQDANQEESQPQPRDTDMENVDFEHLPDAEAQADAQALGGASEEQAVALNEEMAIDVNEENVAPDTFIDDQDHSNDVDGDQMEMESTMPPDEAKKTSENTEPRAFVGEPTKSVADQQQVEKDGDLTDEEDEVEEVDAQLSTVHLDPEAAQDHSSLSTEEARALWTKHESGTRPLSFALTEQLRLILAPTMATKMRGDFRTGKRLNIKRIIPYIASQYKRDKIWMRRSVPSKRTYQIMIALDDSKSMAENGSAELAFQTLALVAKALSMLEAGEISVVGFGENFFVAHPFETPFSSESGSDVVRRFGFEQSKTDVKRLVAHSLDLFREARGRARNTELWQLQLVISDGVCEDHESIARLVRQAQEERIMIVFVIVDSVPSDKKDKDQNKSRGGIMDMKTAEFGVDEGGNMSLKTRRYLDTFPFRWYLVVRDVSELPGVLSAALRQWFAEVVDTQS